MRIIGKWIAQALEQRNEPQALHRIKGQVLELVERFPLYGWLRAPEPANAQ
jgi:glycine hydroxymethyltransferase